MATDPPPSGGLQQQLLAATAQVIVDEGLGAFSLREVARRAGVSHAAPGYHFGDLRGLLTALAVEGFRTLHREMAEAVTRAPDPVGRLQAIGLAYVHVALRYPAHCQVMFREDLIDAEDPAYEQAGLDAFSVLQQTIVELAETHHPGLAVQDAAALCWSAMQGLVQLHPKLARIDLLHRGSAATIDELVARFTTLLVAGLVPGSSQTTVPG